MAKEQLRPDGGARGRQSGAPCDPEPSDRQLLERFTGHQDTSAFQTLMERHKPRVLAACERVLHQAQDAEDACQVTFLVLLRKAGRIGDPDLLANWLCRVAYRTALKALANAARRCEHERQAASRPTPDLLREVIRREQKALLDQELGPLPEKYRAPLVLCYLQGKTNQEAAVQLGWPPGSISSLLARGRELLRDRLAWRYRELAANETRLALQSRATA